MALLYTLTTPVGVFIGVALSGSYNAQSTQALLMQGVFDSISAGILIYDALVNLITANITHSGHFRMMSTARQMMMFLMLWLGAGAMSMLGVWA